MIKWLNDAVKICAILLPAMLLGGCVGDASSIGDPQPRIGSESRAWRSVATQSDRDRLREWRTAFVRGLERARAAGHASELAKQGPLFAPDAALPDVALPPGDYHCRTTKIGAKSEGMLEYVAYPAFACRVSVADDMLSLVKLTGSQRPVGRLFPENKRRMIFLGTLQLGDEQGVLSYSHDTERDMAGILERIGDRRWRLLFPYPNFESLIDVVELVPSQ